MYVTKQSLIRFIVILAMMPLMVLSMNCGKPSAIALESTPMNAKAVAPISFVNIDKNGACGPGQRVRSRILIHSERGPELVTEDCRAISPRALSVAEIRLFPHNLQHATLDQRLFERFEGDPQNGAIPDVSTRFLCRGSVDEKVFDVALIGDLLTIKLAEYDGNGRYVKTLEARESTARETATGWISNELELRLKDQDVAQRKAFASFRAVAQVMSEPQLSVSLDCVQH